VRAEHQPAPGDLTVIPSCNNISPSAEDQMKVVGQDRIAEQINAEGGGEMLHITFNPNLTMIEIFCPRQDHRPSRSNVWRMNAEKRPKKNSSLRLVLAFN